MTGRPIRRSGRVLRAVIEPRQGVVAWVFLECACNPIAHRYMCESPRRRLRRAIVLSVTGWQGNEGGQGGDPYNPDPYNPSPSPNPYGYDPGPQGTAPYPYGPSGGPNPYESGPYQTGGFPAQGGDYGSDRYSLDQYGQYNPYQ